MEKHFENLQGLLAEHRKVVQENRRLHDLLPLIGKHCEDINRLISSIEHLPGVELQQNRHPIFDFPIEKLQLDKKRSTAYHSLKYSGVDTIGQLVAKTEPELLRTKNFGRVALAWVQQILGGFGLHVGMTRRDIARWIPSAEVEEQVAQW